jgi:hypothetical protein
VYSLQLFDEVSFGFLFGGDLGVIAALIGIVSPCASPFAFPLVISFMQY